MPLRWSWTPLKGRKPERGNHCCISSTIGPIAQRLPPELLIPIFENTVHQHYLHAFHHMSTTAIVDHDRVVVSNARIAQRQLLQVIRVCRHWCDVGRITLYSRTFLTTTKQVKLFARTIYASPYVASLVRGIFVVDPDAVYTNKAWFRKRIKERSKNVRVTRELLIAALQACPSVDSFVTASQDKIVPSILPIDKHFQDISRIGHALRTLMLCGSVSSWIVRNPIPFLSPDISLPALEVLVLREVCFPPEYSFPTLPRLHTLCISDSFLYPVPGILSLSGSQLPSLTTVDITRNLLAFSLDQSLCDNLETLYTSSRGRSNVLPSLLGGPTPKLRHLDVGIWHIEAEQYDRQRKIFMTFITTSRLELLHLDVAFAPTAHTSEDNIVVHFFCDLIGAISRAATAKSFALEELSVTQRYPNDNVSTPPLRLGIVVKQLQELCIRHGTKFETQYYIA